MSTTILVLGLPIPLCFHQLLNHVSNHCSLKYCVHNKLCNSDVCIEMVFYNSVKLNSTGIILNSRRVHIREEWERKFPWLSTIIREMLNAWMRQCYNDMENKHTAIIRLWVTLPEFVNHNRDYCWSSMDK